MAIQKTETVNSLAIRFEEGKDAVLVISSTTSWDDPDDSDLPINKTSMREITKTSQDTTYDAETGAPVHSQTATDITGESQLVQDICAVIWTDD